MERFRNLISEERLRRSLVLFAGNSNPPLASSIGAHLGLPVEFPVDSFPDKESNVRLTSNIGKADVIVIQSTSYPQEKNIIDAQLIGDAAIRAGVKNTIVVVPYFGYARQDKKSQPKEPISASVIIRDLAMYFNRIVTVDLHSSSITTAFNGPWDELTALPILSNAIRQDVNKDNLVVSPDKGGTERAMEFTKLLRLKNTEPVTVYKRRDPSIKGVSKALGLMGEVRKKDCIIVDDMIDTAGTITNAARLLMKNGARSVRVVATHGLFSGDALDLIDNSPIDHIVIADTVPRSDKVLLNPKIKIVSVAPIIARAIRLNHARKPLSEDPTLYPET